MQSFILIIGIALCCMALLQFGLWSAQGFSLIAQNKKQFELSRELMKKQIAERTKPTEVKENTNDERWNGFRWFRVARLVKETDVCTQR